MAECIKLVLLVFLVNLLCLCSCQFSAQFPFKIDELYTFTDQTFEKYGIASNKRVEERGYWRYNGNLSALTDATYRVFILGSDSLLVPDVDFGKIGIKFWFTKKEATKLSRKWKEEFERFLKENFWIGMPQDFCFKLINDPIIKIIEVDHKEMTQMKVGDCFLYFSESKLFMIQWQQ